MVGMCSDLAEQLMGVAPVKFGQVGQTGPALGHKLGTDDSCENGPSYWCSSEENAVQCKVRQGGGGGGWRLERDVSRGVEGLRVV